MNGTERAKEEVERQEADLKKLVDQREKLSQIIEARDKEITQAIDDWNKASEKVRPKMKERIKELEAKREEDVWLLGDAEKKVLKAETALSEARVALKREEENQRVRLAQFQEEKENEHYEKLVSSLPGELQKIIDDYESLCSRLASLSVRVQRVFPDGQVRREPGAERLLASLPQKIQETQQQRGWNRSLWRGWGPGNIELTPFFVREGPPGAPIDPGNVARIQHSQRIEDWTKEFYESEK